MLHRTTILLTIVAALNHSVAGPGDLDSTFGNGGLRTVSVPGFTTAEGANAAAMQADGKAVVAGYAGSCIALMRLNTNGTLDTSFGFGGKAPSDIQGVANAVAIQGDGKIVVAGKGTPSSPSFVIARFLANGTLDTNFGTLGSTTVKFGNPSGYNEAYGVAIQPDGKIVTVGQAGDVDGVNFGVVRLNADGSMDSTFGTGGKVSTDFPGPGASYDCAKAVAIQTNGAILVAGETDSTSVPATFGVARYLTNGALDSSFGTGGLLAVTYGTRRSIAYAIGVQSSGRIVVAGSIVGTGVDGSVGGVMLAGLNSDGTLDLTFGDGDGMTVRSNTEAAQDYTRAMCIYPNGSLLTAGAIQLTGQSLDYYIRTFSSNGVPEGSWRLSADLAASYREEGLGLAAAPGSHFVVAGATDQNDSGDMGVVFKDDTYHALSFGGWSTARIDAGAYALALQADGKIVGAGGPTNNKGVTLVRLNTDGAPDTTFGTAGIASLVLNASNYWVSCATVQPDGKIVAAGGTRSATGDYTLLVLRVTSEGALDPTFGTGGAQFYDTGPTNSYENTGRVRIQPDGKILISGVNNYAGFVGRLAQDGTPDTTFGTGGFVAVASYAPDFCLRSDGKIVTGGTLSGGFSMTRLNADGSTDTTFGSGGTLTVDLGMAWGLVESVAEQSDGKVLVGGPAGGQGAIVRCTPDGARDPSFGTNGVVRLLFGATQFNVKTVDERPDGTIVGGGDWLYQVTTPQFVFHREYAVFRLLTNGAADVSFGSNGITRTVFPESQSGTSSYQNQLEQIAVQGDERIVAAGMVLATNKWIFGFARYMTADVPVVPDIAVEHPAGSNLVSGASSVDFGTVTVGCAGSAKVFTLKNTGIADLTVTQVDRIGVNAENFSIDSTATPYTMAPGSNTTFSVTFAPTAAGVRGATLRIASDDPDEDSFLVSLTGTGNAAPTLTLPASPVIAEATGPGGAVVTYSPSANDPEDGALTPIISPPSGSLFPLGDTTVDVSATDSSGASTNGVFVVRVRDTTPPVITLMGSNVMTAYQGLPFMDPGASASDTVGGDLGTNIIVSGSVDTNTVGTYILTYNVSDPSNNAATAVTRTVNVVVPVQLIIDFDTPAAGASVYSYLATFGVTVSAESYTDALRALDENLVYGGAVDPTTADFYLGTVGPPAGIPYSFRLSFALPLAKLEFDNCGISIDSQNASWTATAYNASGQQVAYAEFLNPPWSFPPSTFVLQPPLGQTISYVDFTSTSHSYSAFASGNWDTFKLYPAVGQPPEIAVEQPAGNELVTGEAYIDFGGVASGCWSAPRTFTIKNVGWGTLCISNVTGNVGDIGEFSIDASGMSGTLASGASTTFTVTFAPTAAGPKTATLRIWSNDADESAFDINLGGTGLTALEAWRLAHFGTAQNEGVAADVADPDGDGAPNLAEFGFCLNPVQADSCSRPSPHWDGENLAVTFARPAGVGGITYGAEFSTDLVHWEALPDEGNGDTHIFSISCGSRSRLFMRLTVSSP